MSKNKPLVSIITPLYNTEKYISRAIRSVLNQTYQNFEYILIDDASTDHSKDVVKTFKDPRIRLIEHDKNEGIIATRNEALSLSEGKYVITLDSDDICHGKRIEKTVAFFDRNQSINVLASNTKTFIFHPLFNITNLPPKSFLKENELLIKMIFKCPIVGATASFRSSYINRAPPIYDSRFVHCEDFAMYQRELAKGHLGYLDNPLYYVRIRKDSDTSLGNQQVKKKIEALKPIYKEIFSRQRMDVSDKELSIHLELSFVSFKRNHLEFTFLEKEQWCHFLCNSLTKDGLMDKQTVKAEVAYYLFQNALYHNCVKDFQKSYFSRFFALSDFEVFKKRLKTRSITAIRNWYSR